MVNFFLLDLRQVLKSTSQQQLRPTQTSLPHTRNASKFFSLVAEPDSQIARWYSVFCAYPYTRGMMYAAAGGRSAITCDKTMDRSSIAYRYGPRDLFLFDLMLPQEEWVRSYGVRVNHHDALFLSHCHIGPPKLRASL